MQPRTLSRPLPYVLMLLLSAFSIVYLHAAEQRSATRTCADGFVRLAAVDYLSG
ncbi:hypothetical protein R75461_07875 [Paraburkholderia nemoris]|uniref:hypothetical protein n=1 Tax=Paraburkholderia nemoris TaxID=2793076 RepID=UPI00190D2EFB|nr:MULTISPECIES: hypothetical protein [Paraburkholderia]MBK3786907.1 hypothetical protein [Paraburkholderia aspalathi]CAE6858875.1 hypothetical protein R75461_07875 [Paraburkholderia nemoris]